MNTNESQILPPSMYKQAMETLTEASYKDYRFDESRTSIRKINDSIKQLNSKIYEVERVIDHALKLKTEMAIDQRKLWRSSLSKLTKVSERVTRISKKIHELGA
jgi:predicted TIM-barrel fold metal-dependent hydrolase